MAADNERPALAAGGEAAKAGTRFRARICFQRLADGSRHSVAPRALDSSASLYLPCAAPVKPACDRSASAGIYLHSSRVLLAGYVGCSASSSSQKSTQVI